ncbi:DUF6482 family protein [Pseudomonas aegrilactucae]|uniref:Metal ABC transporter ATPase n=1 Tax=Pseudomonas aegrilactucae TaxID=2854028 RepID=A0A9Q2XJW1_9PSED|nr:DUF6482 family protein [Pseudomonas aegrilactucae]MBV6288066.1 metal ABC transporter ATPase [Pseudomonas aegrilactucae]
MNLQQLTELAQAGQIDELRLVSLEGGIYVLQARRGATVHGVLDEQGAGLRVRSTSHARQLLHGLPAVPCVLVQKVVHDEMCGLAPAAEEPLKIPFTLHLPG